MKKFLLTVTILIVSMIGYAQNNELGIVAGSYNGFSYKRIFNDKFATLSEIGFGFQRTKVSSNGSIGGIHFTVHGTTDLWDIHINQNFLFNYEIINSMYLYLGGGFSVGYASPFNSEADFAKLGFNAIAGVEYRIPSTPLGVAFDFRPGYAGLLSDNSNASIFDWKLALALRYCF